jgi:two-component system chemotaxis response regulator CheB
VVFLTLKEKITQVFVVDDSAMARELLTKIINQAEDLNVIGTAVDPYDAREKIKRLKPDVITLDIEMPKMNGISFLKNLMRLYPKPVIMISTLTEKGAPATLDALALGAVDYLAKPKTDVQAGLEAYADIIQQKIRDAANANIGSIERNRLMRHSITLTQNEIKGTFKHSAIIAIGASTGGTEAIKEVLLAMPEDCPPIVLTQHIPPVFSTSYAERLDRTCLINVLEAKGGEQLKPGHAYLAPGDHHLGIVKQGVHYETRLSNSDLINRHRPSVQFLFDEVLKAAGTNAVAALLTGMGNDGADAMLRMREAGCFTIAQDQASSVVWGMPGAAIKLGGAVEVLSLEHIGAHLLRQCLIHKK